MIPRAILWINLVLVLLLSSATAQQAPPDLSAPKTFPLSLLFYKYMPDAFDDQFMSRQAERQIGQDQYYYRTAVQNRRADYAPVFTEQQVGGRVINFAVKELAPTYRKYWADLASRIPARLRFSQNIQLNNTVGGLEYAGGVLKSKSGTGLFAFSDRFTSEGVYKTPEQTKILLPPLGERDLLSPPPTLQAVVPVAHFPETISALPPSPANNQIFLALDRQIVVPAPTMDARTAEHMWQRPNCDRTRPMTREQLQLLEAECRQYTGNVTITVDIETEGVERTPRGSWIIKARVMNVAVAGPRREVIQSLPASALPKGEDSWAGRDKKQAEQRATTRKAGEQEQQAALKQAESLKDADVIGIQLGMPMEEAEKIVRAHFQVAIVTVDIRKGKTRPDPFQERKTFHNADNSEKIVLFKGDENNNSVIAVARQFVVGPDMTDDRDFTKVKELLKQKYGSPDEDRKKQRLFHWSGKKPKQCLLILGAGAKGGRIVEGNSTKFAEAPYVPSLGYRHVINDQDLPKEVSEMRKCGPVVTAYVDNSLVVALYDVSLMVPYVILPNIPSSASGKPKL